MWNSVVRPYGNVYIFCNFEITESIKLFDFNFDYCGTGTIKNNGLGKK